MEGWVLMIMISKPKQATFILELRPRKHFTAEETTTQTISVLLRGLL